jgi:hypothetical protein
MRGPKPYTTPSCWCLQVNIIVTQAVGVAPGQLPSTLADKLQQLAASPALADLLGISGLTLAQAGKPQTIDLSSAAAGFGSSSTLAAASALGSDAAAFGSGRGAGGGSSDGSSRRAAQAEGPGEGGVATPAVIGMAVAVAVSVMAVCVTAVVIVVVKQRAKAARAAAAAAEDQLPKSAKVGAWAVVVLGWVHERHLVGWLVLRGPTHSHKVCHGYLRKVQIPTYSCTATHIQCCQRYDTCPFCPFCLTQNDALLYPHAAPTEAQERQRQGHHVQVPPD